MKETMKNLKKVYSYGKYFKSCLIIQMICCIIGVAINITIPLIYAKFMVNFTNSIWKQALYMALGLLAIAIVNEFKILIIRKNTQITRRGTVRNMQMSLAREILKLEQTTLDSNSSGAFIQKLTNDMVISDNVPNSILEDLKHYNWLDFKKKAQEKRNSKKKSKK